MITFTKKKGGVLMETLSRSVTAVCLKREEAVSEIQRLHNKGYRQSEISVYSNLQRAKTLERLMGIEIENLQVHDIEEDQSWWESFKTGFLSGSESDDFTQSETVSTLTSLNNDSFSKPLDCLNHYEKELAEGKLVIVVDNYGSHAYI